MDYHISFAGLLVGFLIGLTGMGGGSLLAPILIILFRIPPVWAVASDITYSTVTKAFGSIVYIQHKQVNFSIVFWLACGSIPATLISVLLVQYTHKQYASLINSIIVHLIGFVLVFVAVLLLFKPTLMLWIEHRQQAKIRQKTGAQGSEHRRIWKRPMATILVGAVVGLMVGLTSVGSGTLIVAAIAFLYPRMPSRELIGTDIFQAFLLLLAGFVGYFASGEINWTIVCLLLLGSLPGVLIGSISSKYIPNKYLNPVLAVILGLSGLKLI
ncbi:sulfite exporter TauE/SafE family protein [Dictyobacter kobayashii]|uniref:Probable membrane transporter protein n=1 Tax=Dictyobacter kobayashii TaxID=2014872 RepID=A0A402ACA8_9CHLR|nr:sulfite exporter TauE/SafE family protein [Dictyobacter kobayashii]GCE16737.1 UPF0721 transmembrane protein [Dictyobacter kobayashii]